MNDVITKRRPMIDLDEFERRLGRPCSTDQRDGDPLAELLRIIGDKDEPHKTDLEPKTQLSAMARPDIGETGEWKQPDAQAHLVGGNFAAIEAGLLGTKQPDAVILRDAERSTVENKKPNAASAPPQRRFCSDRSRVAGRAARTNHGDGSRNRHGKCFSERGPRIGR